MKAPTQLEGALRKSVVDTLRFLAADGVEKANSGHPGAPMGQADIAHVLWHEFLRFDPSDPQWPARDRFVLSCGHASMLLYSLLHLWGFPVSMDDLKRFRQWGSITPGHPESHMTPGVEATTGPLGQGVANSVGMALAARMLGARLDAGGFRVMPQRVFALCSDGDLMEGISSEAASLAGHWRLGNLVWLYDDNGITIDGATELSFSEDVARRFEGFGWRTLRADGHDHASIRAALQAATADEARPTLILCRTRIGYGAPTKEDTAKAHGAPLGPDELRGAKDRLQWTAPHEHFHVPAEVGAFYAAAIDAKKAERAEYERGLAAWRAAHPEQAALYDRLFTGGVPADLWAALVAAAPKAGATRKMSGAVLKKAAELLPGLVGGSADLTESNSLEFAHGLVGAPDGGKKHTFSYAGRQMHFGIREHAMGAITNGMLRHGGLRPFSGTFLVFSDYMRPSVRLAALSELPNIFIFSHDSVFLGEDGPTHQPVEHHWALRHIPGLAYWRPADGLEVAMAWAWALESRHRPAAIALTRQNVPAIERPAGFDPRDALRGGYVVSDSPDPDVILVGTGSELQLCVAAADALRAEGRRPRVVSMPCWNLFAEQEAAWRESVLPAGHARVVSVEAGITLPWRAVGATLTLGIDRFGASAPFDALAENFGLTAEQVTRRVREWLES